MKVGILTLKFHSNFGYLMQSYAMQKIVRDLGHEPYHFYIKEEPESLSNRIIVFFKKIIKNTFMGFHYTLFSYHPSREDMEFKDKNTWNFIHKYINLTPYIPTLTTKTSYNIPIYDAYIVGSDQVWRREFTDDIRCYFFNFIPEKAKRMSYAASFGTTTLSYSNNVLQTCKKLLAKFDIVTVREDDGVRICNDLFGCKATKVLDPTLLLSSNDYLSLIEDPATPFCNEPYIFTYILRPNSEKSSFIKKFTKDMGLKVINIMPAILEKVGRKRLSECVYPSISTWLKGFSQADYIITDSYHASVFSIIFNKQFYVINDSFGGVTRIHSLLASFGLLNRYADCYDGNVQMIDYTLINKKKADYIKQSLGIFQTFFKHEA